MLSFTIDRLSQAAKEWSMQKVLSTLHRKDWKESKLKLTKESTSDSGVFFLYPTSLSLSEKFKEGSSTRWAVKKAESSSTRWAQSKRKKHENWPREQTEAGAVRNLSGAMLWDGLKDEINIILFSMCIWYACVFIYGHTCMYSCRYVNHVCRPTNEIRCLSQLFSTLFIEGGTLFNVGAC